jgi:hypothetical protein
VPDAYRWLLLVALAGIAAAVLLTAARSRRHRQLIRQDPTPIDRMTPGAPLAFVAGRAAAGPGGPLTAPLSGAACVWFEVTVEKAVRVRFNRTVWRPAWRGGPGCPFALTDSTGAVLVSDELPRHSIVDTPAAELREQTFDKHTGARSPAGDPWITALIHLLDAGGQRALADHLRRGGGGVRCVEQVLRNGTRLGVVGRPRDTGAGVVLERTLTRVGGATPASLKRLREMSGKDGGGSLGFVVLVLLIVAGWAWATLTR